MTNYQIGDLFLAFYVNNVNRLGILTDYKNNEYVIKWNPHPLYNEFTEFKYKQKDIDNFVISKIWEHLPVKS